MPAQPPARAAARARTTRATRATRAAVRMHSRALFAMAMLAPALAAACVTGMAGATDAQYRPAEDPPVRFVTVDGVPAEDTCRSPMIDPRDQMQIRLARSWQEGNTHRGDYEVPVGRYGVRDGELLRIDCLSGEPIGIVRN
jgi:hypothetical protein